jgi:hypothetical protein
VASIRAISPPLETPLPVGIVSPNASHTMPTGKCVSKGGEIALMPATQCPQVSVSLKVEK